MNDSDFVPFIPRQILKHVPNAESGSSATDARVPQPCEYSLQLGTQQPDESSQQPVPGESGHQAPADESSAEVREARDESQEDKSPPESTFSLALEEAIESSTRDAEIRCAAVRLACIATGRILHHAVAFDPQIVARFVDDAIGAAHRDDAFVRVDRVEQAAASKHGRSFREDARLDAGQVVLDFPSGSLGATLEERAELTVRAAADD